MSLLGCFYYVKSLCDPQAAMFFTMASASMINSNLAICKPNAAALVGDLQ